MHKAITLIPTCRDHTQSALSLKFCELGCDIFHLHFHWHVIVPARTFLRLGGSSRVYIQCFAPPSPLALTFSKSIQDPIHHMCLLRLSHPLLCSQNGNTSRILS